MDAKIINQKEYLKKYLSSGNGEEKKKKKKKLKVGSKTVKIIDDDIDLKKLRPIEDGEFDIFIDVEDAPQIAGVVDERGPVDFSDKRKWKIIATDEDGELRFKSSEKEKPEFVISDEKEIAKDSKGNNGDISPSRRNIEDEDSNINLPRRRKKSKHSKKSKHDYDSDFSPPRKNRKSKDLDFSPPRRSKKDNDSDFSPPRKHKKNNYSDFKRSKSNKQNYTSDLSPSRQSRKVDDSDLSPPRRNKKGDRSNSKHSKKINEDNDSDLSPPRKSRKDEDSTFGPARKDQRQHKDFKETTNFKDSSKSDANYNETNSSLFYKCKDYGGSDRSPSRQLKHKMHSSKSFKKDRWKDNDDRYEHCIKNNDSRQKERSLRWDDQSDRNGFTNEESIDRHDAKMKKTLSGKTAGLQDAKALREESEAFKKREAEVFSKLGKEVTGAGQKAIVRDSKTGRKRDLEAEAAVEREKQKRQDELNEKYEKWGRGLKQVEDREEKLKNDLYEMSKPLARYADDADLDKQLREQEREGDPMLDYIRQKQIKEGKRKPDRPQYQGSYMPNRFGIKPGHRWDGVDRSNGYEKKWFDAQNAKLARQEEAYKWSTADM